MLAAAKYIGALFATSKFLRPLTTTAKTVVSSEHIKSKREAYWLKHHRIMKHAQRGGGLELSLFNDVLFSDKDLENGLEVQQQHLDLCKDIVSSSITVPLPKSGNSQGFTKIAGPATDIPSNPKVPGAYSISSSNELDSRCYVGRSNALGKRVRDHGYGRNQGTKDFINSLGNNGMVTIYKCPALPDYYGLTLTQFLWVLELYLFITIKPSENKSYVPLSGFSINDLQAEEGNFSAHNAMEVYVYRRLEDGSLEYLYYSDNTRKFQRDLGVGNQYVGNVTLRTQGWFRSVILFSRKLLKEGETPLMTMDELRDYYYGVKDSIPRRDTKCLRVINNDTGQVHVFNTRKELRAALGIVRPDSTKYSITTVSRRDTKK